MPIVHGRIVGTLIGTYSLHCSRRNFGYGDWISQHHFVSLMAWNRCGVNQDIRAISLRQKLLLNEGSSQTKRKRNMKVIGVKFSMLLVNAHEACRRQAKEWGTALSNKCQPHTLCGSSHSEMPPTVSANASESCHYLFCELVFCCDASRCLPKLGRYKDGGINTLVKQPLWFDMPLHIP